MNSLNRDIDIGEVVIIRKNVLESRLDFLPGRALIVMASAGRLKDSPGEVIYGRWLDSGLQIGDIPSMEIDVTETNLVHLELGHYPMSTELRFWWKRRNGCLHPRECAVEDEKGYHCKWCMEIDILEDIISSRDTHYQNLLGYVVDVLLNPMESAVRDFQDVYGPHIAGGTHGKEKA